LRLPIVLVNASSLKKVKLVIENLSAEKAKVEKEKTKKTAGKGKPSVRLGSKKDVSSCSKCYQGIDSWGLETM